MNSLRNLPPIDEIMADPQLVSLSESYSRALVVEECRRAVDSIRKEIKDRSDILSREELREIAVTRTLKRVEEMIAGTLYPVVNGTGVVLHTNLGRSLLGERAIKMLNAAARSYVNLEIDMITGERGSRYYHVEELLCRLTGAEAALVVNNNAAAVMLALNTIANGGEGIVSRGQLVEIGGSFRVPEVMKASGTRLVEVGTTNKTYIRDYEAAITEETRVLLSVHTSNYRIVGFTHEPTLQELVELGKCHQLPVMVDLGSGILLDLAPYGLTGELTMQDCVRAGADIVTASGDKLLGGPQAGIIVGKRQYVEAMKKNQLTRALRVDKLIISALEGTLIEYLAGKPECNLPAIRMLIRNPEDLRADAEELADIIGKELAASDIPCSVEVVPVADRVGGGAFPIEELPGFGVAIHVGEELVDTLAARLRQRRPGFLLRVREGALISSLRTMLPGDGQLLAAALAEELAAAQGR